MLDRIRLWWKFEGSHYRRDFIKGVKNLWRWFPTIWKDRDWDSYYIYEILRVKIQNQAKYIGDRDFHTEAKRDSERMMLVSRLIKLQQDEFYRMEYMEYEETDHWFEPSKYNPDLFEWKYKTLSERYDDYFKKYSRQYKRVLNGEINRFKRDELDKKDKHVIAMEIAHENQERCSKLIFKILHDHIERWWD